MSFEWLYPSSDWRAFYRGGFPSQPFASLRDTEVISEGRMKEDIVRRKNGQDSSHELVSEARSCQRF